jgi:pimeloyl-ACP methyl ester carboxylesterase
MSAAGEVSVYDRMCWPEAELERALALGAHRRELAAYLGGYEYTTLAALARRSHAARRRRGTARPRLKVYLLPGILGSQLGRARPAGQPPDLLWIDPSDIVRGRLIELRLPRAGAGKSAPRASHTRSLPPLQPMGAIVYSYLALKLRLSAAGLDVVLHDYDWRGDVMAQGQALAARLAADDADELALIGHSMGALLARATLAHYGRDAGAERITRVIGLGAPHGGSIAAVQALRASYPIVGRLAAIDRRHDAQALTRLAFRGFLSLYQLLPAPDAALDLFDPDSWPASGTRPDPKLLRTARGFARQLATADQRFVSIVGTGQRTVTGIERRGAQFRYRVSSAGDGTVASACATLAGARSYCLRCEHSELPRNEQVAAALVDLLRRGSTRRLRAGVTGHHGRSSYVTDAVLSRELGRKIDWYSLGIGERRQYLNRLNDPPRCYRARSRAGDEKIVR